MSKLCDTISCDILLEMTSHVIGWCAALYGLLLLTFWLLLLPLWDSVIVLCFVVRYFMSILVLQPS